MSYPLAKEMAFKKIGYPNFYKKVRRLLDEGYLAEWRGSLPGPDLLHLTKKGFEWLKPSLGEFREDRFLPQSAPHDYWATAFHLGEFVHEIPQEVKFFTEQELHCTDDSLLPEWVPKSRSHVPDGLTRVKIGGETRVVAIEVELNLKPYLRYDKAAYYFDAGLSKFDVVVWLCGTEWIKNEIAGRLKGLRLRNLGMHHYVLTTDYLASGWQAQLSGGDHEGKTLEEIYLVNRWSKPGLSLDYPWVTKTREIYFPTYKSPRSLKRYRKLAPPANS